MKQNRFRNERRNFLKLGSFAAASLVIAAQAGKAAAQGAAVDEKDAVALSVGYVADAARADKAKYKQYAAGQACAGCHLYQGKPGSAAGGCPIFPGKVVNAKGWCSAYVKE